MTTAQEVFEAAMGLMDEINETTGSADTADTAEYKRRTLFILNVLRGELYPYSDTYEADDAGSRPISAVIEDFDSAIALDDYICQTLLPYGLAYHLLLDENQSTAMVFKQRYETLKMQLAQGLPQQSEDIIDLYGGIEYGEFGRW